MSRRREEEPPDPEAPELPPPEPPEDVPELEVVEYLLPDELVDSVRTSVPNSEQESQSSSSAPSTLVVVRDDFSAPHISHWGIHVCTAAESKNHTHATPAELSAHRSDHAP
ncbi:hypothetical protein AArcSl_0504 [Halalkaliarchaeum desulfuricum]|uniref:Uncharacterized protein n=1 Tax=Halalkaliarchaeum desulfuricum TaxID=2055893 RepID=A0A343TGD3_9EURY|nr:hypothetical protein AArcSl_0504 [Halalkaliarchaeum desulfuricum]